MSGDRCIQTSGPDPYDFRISCHCGDDVFVTIEPGVLKYPENCELSYNGPVFGCKPHASQSCRDFVSAFAKYLNKKHGDCLNHDTEAKKEYEMWKNAEASCK